MLNAAPGSLRRVKEMENVFIPLSDGTKLAARIWLPEDAEAKPVPAILEYLPYRKRDGTHVRDALTHPYLAARGYACVRVDMRGNGDSDGVMLDEYTKQEQDDAIEVIAWLTIQKWCTGKVGMMGISWGGFNALQVAARAPQALKAIITLCSTDDRYADDIHYKGGCLINENLGWAATMLACSSLPPDPKIVGAKWKKMWLERLRKEPFLVIPWLQHPHRDAYWKHGSVNENFGAIEAAVLCVGGWNDAYSNAVPRLMKGLRSTCKAIIGPWAHKYPHFAVPEPRIGFLQEALRWWDFWLKGEPTGVSRDPAFRTYIMNAAKPGGTKGDWPGRWVSDETWMTGRTDIIKWHLNADGIGGAAGEEKALTVSSPLTTGLDGGEYCIMGQATEFPGDQTRDDEGSLIFDSPALVADMDIVGAPLLELELSSDKPVAFLAARLNDVWPTGEVSRVTYGLLNLAHRDSHEVPSPLEPGKRYKVKLRLDDIAIRIPKGHRLRIALSTSYWPLMWPAPETATVTVHAGASTVQMPIRREVLGEMPPGFKPAESAEAVKQREIKAPWNRREVSVKDDVTTLETIDDYGAYEIEGIKLVHHSIGREWHSIRQGDPLSATMKTHWTEIRSRGKWKIRTETHGELKATRTHWLVKGRIEAFEGAKKIFTKTFNEKIQRKLG